MRTALSSLMLALLATPAFAEPVPLSEPHTIGLAAGGVALALWIARRRKK